MNIISRLWTSKKCVGSKKIFGPETFLVIKKFLVSKTFGSQNNFEPKKILVWDKLWVQKNFWSQKIFTSETKKWSVWNKFLVRKKCWINVRYLVVLFYNKSLFLDPKFFGDRNFYRLDFLGYESLCQKFYEPKFF